MAQQQIFRNFSVYSNGKKHGNCSKASLDLESAVETYVADDGHIGTSRAKKTVKLSFSEYVPYSGKPEQDFIYQAWKTSEYVTMTCGILGGKVLTFAGMTVTKVKYDTDMAKGTCTMDVEMEGPPPDES